MVLARRWRSPGEAGEGAGSGIVDACHSWCGAAAIVDVRRCGALHAQSCWNPAWPPLHCGGHRIRCLELRYPGGAGTTMLAVPVPDSALRVAGSVPTAGPHSPFNTRSPRYAVPHTDAESDDSPSERNRYHLLRPARHRGRHRHGLCAARAANCRVSSAGSASGANANHCFSRSSSLTTMPTPGGG